MAGQQLRQTVRQDDAQDGDEKRYGGEDEISNTDATVDVGLLPALHEYSHMMAVVA